MADTRAPVILRRFVAVLALTLALLLALSACGGSDASDRQQVEQAEPAEGAVGVEAPMAGQEEDAASGAGGGDAAADEGGAGPDAEPGVDVAAAVGGGSGRRVVTSSIDVAVPDVPAAARRVRDAALVAGGFVAAESTSGGDRPRAEITVRVPVGADADLLDTVAALGEEVARTADTQDVEGTLVDLESRTATQRAGVERIRALLQEATSLEDVLALEVELTRRQADLESVQSQQAALADRAALATVTVVLTRPDDAAGEQEVAPPFLSGLGAGWDALVASTAVVLLVAGTMLPFVVVVAVVLAVVLLTRRARRPRRPAVAGSVGAGSVGAPAAAGPDSTP